MSRLTLVKYNLTKNGVELTLVKYNLTKNGVECYFFNKFRVYGCFSRNFKRIVVIFFLFFLFFDNGTKCYFSINLKFSASSRNLKGIAIIFLK